MQIRFLALSTSALMFLSVPASAQEGAMHRVFACKGVDAGMEVYVPDTALQDKARLRAGVIGR